MYHREDWTLFRTLETLAQKAGVPVRMIPGLVAKELVDNALDAGGYAQVGLLDGNGLWVEDDGDGIPGDDGRIAHLFSVNRPLASTKLVRLPTRGALGNGLRVVAGAVLATGGTLTVSTRGRTLRLVPDEATGATRAEHVGHCSTQGTRVEVRLGPAADVAPSSLRWANLAIDMAAGPGYRGKTSPHWYDTDSFVELLRAAAGRTVREVVAEFDGCAGAAAGTIAAGYKGRLAAELDRADAESLLDAARRWAKPVSPKRLGRVDRLDDFEGYHRVDGTFPAKAARGRLHAELPYVVEAWARPAKDAAAVVFVNRTPITGDVQASHDKRNGVALHGCGLNHYVTGRCPKLAFRLNVTTPHMPLTSDGKSPDLLRVLAPITEATTKAARRVKKATATARAPGEPSSIKTVILANLAAGADKAGGGGEYRFSLRQLFYAVRPAVIEFNGQELDYNYFSQVVTEHEAAAGEIPGMYRDPRGTLYHPHTGEEIPLGTLNVEGYRRPGWTFNKILYCEKEGFFPILRAAGWPERNDCALLSSKGFASRAARDVLDLLGDTGEEITFFAIHDADAYGTMIYQALQEGTLARPGRRAAIVNLGLEPDEAVAMGLQVEPVRRAGDRSAPVAEYVAPEWREWLQGSRVELNAMTTPQFLEWLDAKFRPYAGKVVPPDGVMAERLKAGVRSAVRRRIKARVLRRARLDERTERAVRQRAGMIAGQLADLDTDVRARLNERPGDHWSRPVDSAAEWIARHAPVGGASDNVPQTRPKG